MVHYLNHCTTYSNEAWGIATHCFLWYTSNCEILQEWAMVWAINKQLYMRAIYSQSHLFTNTGVALLVMLILPRQKLFVWDLQKDTDLWPGSYSPLCWAQLPVAGPPALWAVVVAVLGVDRAICVVVQGLDAAHRPDLIPCLPTGFAARLPFPCYPSGLVKREWAE